MAVIIQQVIGEKYGDYVYPAISGIAQSHNYYPFSKMKPEDGIATIALGLGKSVMEGEKALRFSPPYPELLPQRSTVDDILENAQRHFYSIKMESSVLRGKLPVKRYSDSITTISDLKHALKQRNYSDNAIEAIVQWLDSSNREGVASY